MLNLFFYTSETTIKNLIDIMKLLIKDRMVYTIKNGKLEKLGAALELERISEEIFKADDTYVI